MSRKDLLGKIKVNRPCEADWDSMIGNDQIRFCEHCNLTVQDLSQLTPKRITRLVTASNGRLCVRYQRGPDGSLVTKGPPQELLRLSRSASRLVAGAFSATLSLSSNTGYLKRPYWSASFLSEGSRQELPVQGRFLQREDITLAGTIVDPNGAVIAGANVTLLNDESGIERAVNTSDDGQYLFQNLIPGTYRLRIQHPGFAVAEVTQIVLQPDDHHRVDATLEVAAISETVGVVGFIEAAEPLVKAAQQDDLEAVLSLLGRSDVNLRDKITGSTALEHAVGNGNREMVQALLHASANVNSLNESKQTALMMLGGESTSEIVWDLINAGAKVNLKDDEGDTALIEAAMVDNFSVLTALLQAGADVDAKNDEGQTALMVAASNGLRKQVKALIAAGADMNGRDKEGKTPLNYARENDHEKVIKLLLSYGALEGEVKVKN